MAAFRNRVVVTGLGAIAPTGIGKDTFWNALLEGRSGITDISLFDTAGHRSRIAGEVKGFDLGDYHETQTRAHRLARHAQFALAGTRLALQDAGLTDPEALGRQTVPLFVGVSTSGMDIVELTAARLHRRGPHRVPGYGVTGSQPHHAASLIAEELGIVSESHTLASACTAGHDAVTGAVAQVRSGKSDLAVGGGTDAPITALTFAGLQNAGLASLRNEDPEHASRPFDRDSRTGCISEGCGMLVFENLESALARNAPVYMEITGHGSRVDPDPGMSASGLADAMVEALANAGRRPRDIDCIWAHGPGHPEMDRNETDQIKKLFGAHAYDIPVTSIKGSIGNPLAAAGALQLIACACATRDGLIPPTANLEHPAPGCDLDYVTGEARRNRLNCMLVNGHGLGGANTCVVVERAPEA